MPPRKHLAAPLANVRVEIPPLIHAGDELRVFGHLPKVALSLIGLLLLRVFVRHHLLSGYAGQSVDAIGLALDGKHELGADVFGISGGDGLAELG